MHSDDVEHPKAKGDRCTLAVMLALQSLGFSVLVPFGENTRYDLVIDDGDRFARVQCKAGRFRGGAIWFKTVSSYAHHRSASEPRRDYQGQIDFFGVHCWETGGVYLVPIAEIPNKSTAALRVEATQNRQSKRIRLAADYEVARLHAWTVQERPSLITLTGSG
jgi:PD-(D/E)XK nuclease superfamily protein